MPVNIELFDDFDAVAVDSAGALDRTRQPSLFDRLDWYRLTPQERWRESMKLWELFRIFGGSLDPEPDYQSPFYDPEDRRSTPAQEGSGVRLVRRSGV